METINPTFPLSVPVLAAGLRFTHGDSSTEIVSDCRSGNLYPDQGYDLGYAYL